MGYAVLIAGILMLVTAYNNTYKQFAATLAGDFTGPGNFTYWLAGFGAVGALGYIDAFKTFSRLFLTLLIISMVLSNRGFFAKFTQALKTGPATPAAT